MKLAAIALLLGLAGAAPGTDFVSTHPQPWPGARPPGVDEIDRALADPARLRRTRVVFVGDSITALWLGPGRPVWDQHFATPGSANYALDLGVGGDRTENVLYRILPKAQGGLGELDAPQLDPEVIVLMVGVNNADGAGKLIENNVYAGIRAVLIALHARKPQARIVLQSLLPTGFAAVNQAVVLPVNGRLRALAQNPVVASYTRYLDLYPYFIDARGYQDRRYFSDGLHPNEAGYRVWRDKLVPFLAELRKKRH